MGASVVRPQHRGVVVRINDVGGLQGFGPIEVDEPEEQFHYEWESRSWPWPGR